MNTGNLAEWAIALAIFMHALGDAINVEADSKTTTRIVLYGWLVCAGVFVLLALVSLGVDLSNLT